ncbi:ATP binding protein, putative [Ricinus communis]|uniref:ATP binding protein, putative n=1 Tax=Ricinus communis TaxID=3988 RepID=B9RXU2_RICCO|nr:ATP binding protein, putative [Ricinus communis]|eukprot:XP_002518561.1 cysteine-rich receptor-like protein kinase 26 [Ricinus communis]
MGSLKLLISWLFVLLLLLSLTIAQPNFIQQSCDNSRGNYTANTPYKANLDNILSSLASDTEIDYGFYNLSIGESPNQVNAIALCRGDVGVDNCRGCISNSTRKITEVCPNQIDAFGIYDFCTLRYSNRSILGVVEGSPILYLINVNNASDVSQYTQALTALLDRLRSETTSGDSVRKFATGNETAGFERVYALMQCTPDLTEEECDVCLGQAISEIGSCCAGRTGAAVFKPSCHVRFEEYLFYTSTPPPVSPVPTPPAPPIEEKKSNKSRTIIAIIVPTVSVLIFIISFCIFLRKRRPRKKAETVEEMESPESFQLDFGTVRVATDNFSEENKLGQGGFGAVYKGTLYNGQDIAVKRLSKNSEQGDLEFKNEILLVAKLQHRNLVRLLGFCLERNERLLIYEFMPNTSLDHFLFDQTKHESLDWERRYKIICGIARGLLYLHEDSQIRIIHRDLKTSNILLDMDMNPKIADFGMARLFVIDQTQGNTSRIVGTYGYMAPEYAMHGQFSIKSDVFSFGVLLLEILSGKKNSSFHNGERIEDLLSYAWRNWREGTSMNVIDPSLKSGSSSEMMRCIQIGLLCVQENVADRPTMATVVLMLNSYSLTLPVPLRPAFFMHTGIHLDVSSVGMKL